MNVRLLLRASALGLASIALSPTITSATRVITLERTATPSVTSLSPTDGPNRGGTLVTVVGTGLGATTAVTFGRKAASFTIASNDDVHAVAPAGSGVVAVRISLSSTQHPVFAGDFHYLSEPTVASLAPNQGGARGGSHVLVRGTGFVEGTRVFIGPLAARSVRVLNADELEVVTPPGFGTVALRVVTPGGGSSVTASARFTYVSRVLVIGDSLGIDLEWGFPSNNPSLQVTDEAVGSTGLVRQDFYDWPAHLRADLSSIRPTIVIALFGANDHQAIVTPRGTIQIGTAAWDAAYRARVRQLRSIVASSGAFLAWVGLPRVAPTADIPESFVATIDQLDASVMEGDPSGCFVNTSSLFTTPSGGYTPLVQVSPHVVEIGHTADGIHFTVAGATVVDTLAIDAITRHLG